LGNMRDQSARIGGRFAHRLILKAPFSRRT
jgi:hypothetical protein